VEQFVLEDRRVSIEDIAQHFTISEGSVFTILHDHLHMSKVSARWVPRNLSDEQKQTRVTICQSMITRHDADPKFLGRIITMDETWIPLYNPETKRQSSQWKHRDSPPPKKFRVVASQEKVLYAVFWDMQGVILAHPIPKGSTITGAVYANILAKNLLPALQEKRSQLKRKHFIFHHDNAPPHTSHVVLDFFHDKHIELVPHAPYSPDLAPSDFWLFPNLKDALRGRHFNTRAALGSAISQWCIHTPQDLFSAAFTQWIERCRKCVALDGGYVEKD